MRGGFTPRPVFTAPRDHAGRRVDAGQSQRGRQRGRVERAGRVTRQSL